MKLTQLFLLFKVSICAMNGGQAESGEMPVRSDEMIAIFFCIFVESNNSKI